MYLPKAIIERQGERKSRKVAREVGISQSYYLNIRAGRKVPTVEVLERIATVIETEFEPLLWIWICDKIGQANMNKLIDWITECA